SFVTMLILLVFAAFLIASLWRLFSKAGAPGWASLVPLYNIYVLTRIAGKPGWWTVLQFIPLVNFIVGILICLGLAKNFGRGSGFAMGLMFLGFIFVPILAFGDSQYEGEPI